MKKLVLGQEELKTLYIDESVQDKFDLLVVTLKMLGMNVTITASFENDGERDGFEFARVAFSNGTNLDDTSMFGNVEIYSFSGGLDCVDIEIYGGSEGNIKYNYIYANEKVEKLFEMLDKVLLYIE